MSNKHIIEEFEDTELLSDSCVSDSDFDPNSEIEDDDDDDEVDAISLVSETEIYLLCAST